MKKITQTEPEYPFQKLKKISSTSKGYSYVEYSPEILITEAAGRLILTTRTTLVVPGNPQFKQIPMTNL